jgi:hypothetical protein
MLVHTESVEPSVDGQRKVEGGGTSRESGSTDDGGSRVALSIAVGIKGGVEAVGIKGGVEVVGRNTCKPLALLGISCSMISKCSKPFIMKGFA